MNCTAMDNPCRTIQYALDNVTMSDDVIKIDGSQESFTVPREVLISKCMNITFTSYNGVVWIYREVNLSVPNPYGTFVVITSSATKTRCKLLFNNINFRDTALLRSYSLCHSESALSRHTLDLTLSLTVKNCLFDFSKYKNSHRSGLIMIHSQQLVLNIEDCKIKTNYAAGILNHQGNGHCMGAISTRITFKNTRIEDALYAVKADLKVVKHRLFELKISNSLIRSRGKYHVATSQFLVVLDHQAMERPAIIYMENSRFEHLSVETNTAAVMDIKGASSVTIKDCTFIGNVGSRGGALSFKLAFLEILNSHFYDNRARVTTLCAHGDQEGRGGAIFIDDTNKGDELRIYNSSFRNNAADCLGSAVYVGNFHAVSVIQTYFSTRFTGLANTIWFSYSYELLFDRVSFVGREESMLSGGLFHANAEKFTFEKHSPHFKCPLRSIPNVSVSNMHKSKTVFKSSRHVTCNSCPKGEYTFRPSNLSGLNGINSIKNTLQPQCQSCSFGAVCKRGIKPKPNFWGYVHKGKAFMTVCPPGYCCQKSDQCVALNSCSSKRTGRLCGRCKEGYFQSVFTNDCLENEACNAAKFWAVAILICVLLTVLFIFLKDIFLFIVKLLKVDKLFSDAERRSDWLREYLFTKKYSRQLTFTCDKSDKRDPVNTDSNDSREGKKDEHCEMQQESSSDSRATGLIKIVFFFYQINSILTVYNSIRENHYLNNLKVLILSVFNLNSQVPSLGTEFHCAVHGMGSTTKVWIRALLPVLCLMLAVVFYGFVYILSHFFRSRQFIKKYSEKAKSRLLIAILQLILLGYSTLTSSTFSLVTCIPLVNGHKVLYIDGEIPCYQNWQIAVIMFILLWAGPLIFALHKLPSYMKKSEISLGGVFIALMLPLPFAFYSVARFIKEKFCPEADNASNDHGWYPLISTDEKKQQSNVMFQLVDVIESPFRHKSDDKKDEKLSWEPILLLQRILLSLCCTFVLQPGMRSLFLLLSIIIFSYMNAHYRPFNSGFLNATNGIIFIVLCITGIINAIYAFIYEYGTVPKGPLVHILRIFDYLEVGVILIFPAIAAGTFVILLLVKFAVQVSSFAGFIIGKYKRFKPSSNSL